MKNAAPGSGLTVKNVVLLLFVVIVFIALTAKRPEPIVGWWKATDSTVFHFRKDGSFVGKDYVGRPIWGHWSELGDNKYGFQSLFHMGSYDPQYAVVTGRDKMKYVGSAAVVFIHSERISEAEGAKVVAEVMAAMPTENRPSRSE